MGTDSPKKIKAMRWSYLVFALSSFPIGGAMVAAPLAFWGAFGLALEDPILATVYGGGVVGEGVVCLWGWFRPQRAVGILVYMLAYKGVVVAALLPRLLAMAEPPAAGWMIVAFWGFVAVWAALLLPWGRWADLDASAGS